MVGKLVLADIGCLFVSFMAHPDDRLLPPNGQCHFPRECRSFPPSSSCFMQVPLFFAACPPIELPRAGQFLSKHLARRLNQTSLDLFLVDSLTWHQKGVIADSDKIIDYHIGINEHGAHLPACWMEEVMQNKMEHGRVQIDWLTCDDHWSNPLILYINKFMQTRPDFITFK